MSDGAALLGFNPGKMWWGRLRCLEIGWRVRTSCAVRLVVVGWLGEGGEGGEDDEP